MGLYQRGQNRGIDWYDGYTGKRELIGASKGEAKKALANRKAERLRDRQSDSPPLDAPPFNRFVEDRYTQDARTSTASIMSATG